jgi:hypothetical protein
MDRQTSWDKTHQFPSGFAEFIPFLDQNENHPWERGRLARTRAAEMTALPVVLKQKWNYSHHVRSQGLVSSFLPTTPHGIAVASGS